MPKCETCGNDYDKTFQVTIREETHEYDSFECAIEALAPSLSRCRRHVGAAAAALRKAHALVLVDDPPELVALELRAALDQIGETAGAVHPPDLLDRSDQLGRFHPLFLWGLLIQLHL